ncbi:hypothetical protein RLPCCGM1_p0107 [Rhizobium leguminosarum bv. phaseoli CCGM1]|nr:hypothetical protein RLPCCGM1_p0107 [Rhizobium leguminosarum bv. phaseoli CCGM1]
MSTNPHLLYSKVEFLGVLAVSLLVGGVVAFSAGLPLTA